MTIRTDYVLIGLMAVMLLWVFYESHTTDVRIDNHEKELKSLEDSLQGISQSRKTDSLRIESLQLTIDSIKTAKSIITRKASHERTVIRNASADSLAHIVRSGLIEVQP